MDCIAVGGLDLLVGLDLDQPFGGSAVDAVGFEPDVAAGGRRRVVDRDRGAGGELDALAAHAPEIIQLRVADADGDVEIAVASSPGGVQDAQSGADIVRVLIGDFIGKEIGLGICLLLQDVEVPLQLLGQGVENSVGLVSGGRLLTAGGRRRLPEDNSGKGQRHGQQTCNMQYFHNV